MFPASLRRPSLAGLLLVLLATLTACSGQSDVRGTYEVELRVPKIGVPLNGTLVLGARSLEIGDGAWIVPNARGGGEIEDEDDLLLEVNSCLVLMSARTGAAHSVMLFEVRARPDGIELPFGFFDSGKERIEVTDVSLFANALSGDLVFADEDGIGRGKLYGDRTGDPDGDYCTLAHARFLEAIEAEARRDGAGTDEGDVR